MSDKFFPASMHTLCQWIFTELDTKGSIFGTPKELFYCPTSDSPNLGLELYRKKLSTPIGVAAGPHTQLAQNIIVAWLHGARFLELKTVQTLDELDVSKPCIDAEDTTYNCEWSQELKLKQSAEEYAKAWVLIHALSDKLGIQAGLDTIFNMSVGYNLSGIKSDNVQRFLDTMRDASELIAAYKKELSPFYPQINDIDVPSQISDNITLSTMHGCPPQEIEEIANYLLRELGVHTAIKMNPTLLGPSMLRGILNEELGFKDIVVPDEAFAHDTKYPDAIEMIRRLMTVSHDVNLEFGLKLTNTLEVENYRSVFPENEKMMYMSGRALHPLTISIAAQLRSDLGPLQMSLSGGADAFNLADILTSGLSPVTVCTDLLKPGGYGRLPQYLKNLADTMNESGAEDLASFARIKSSLTQNDDAYALNLERYVKRVKNQKAYRTLDHQPKIKGRRPLGWFDCIAAPCMEGCPATQHIPEYMHQVAEGHYEKAYDVIHETNALPKITGAVCDHPCELRCVRNNYDEPLAIRGIKRFVAEKVGTTQLQKEKPLSLSNPQKVAIIGGGPAGLSAAYYLAKSGAKVTIFEARDQPGGTVSATIPRFRLELDDILADSKLCDVLGIEIRYNQRIGENLSFEELRANDYHAIVIATGANIGKQMGIEGEDAIGVYDGYGFLSEVRQNEKLNIGEHTVIVGGGNAAMDAARTAWRLGANSDPAGRVSLLYRRTRAEMPADPDEIKALQEEGVEIVELAVPISVKRENGKIVGLRCQKMRLGSPDASGRRRPSPIEGSEYDIACTTMVVCVSQEADLSYLGEDEIKRTSWGTLDVDPLSMETSVANIYAGGDVARGPSTIIQAIADGRIIAQSILETAGLSLLEEYASTRQTKELKLHQLRSERLPRVQAAVKDEDERRNFEEVDAVFTEEQAQKEAARCLLCDEMCNLCVTVCPNMANLSYNVEKKHAVAPIYTLQGNTLIEESTPYFAVEQSLQIINLADFCNECGNCNTFCPTQDAPYQIKPRLCLDEASFNSETERGIILRRQGDALRLRAHYKNQELILEKDEDTISFFSSTLYLKLNAESFEIIDAVAEQQAYEGGLFDTRPAFELATLLIGIEKDLPWLIAPNE